MYKTYYSSLIKTQLRVMQTFMKLLCLCFFLLIGGTTTLLAQDPEEIETTPATGTEEEGPLVEDPADAPIDEVVKKEIVTERRILKYPLLRESDVFWEKRIWRIIDVREKMNLPFAYPEDPFFKILSDAATKGDLPVYSTDEDGAKFKKRLSTDDVLSM
ncbi:MAG TPA: hypothetical protein DCF33_00265, partial [Saprospirales bacterium]|nr:hypothetical protein [Saprospirales bacterium]